MFAKIYKAMFPSPADDPTFVKWDARTPIDTGDWMGDERRMREQYRRDIDAWHRAHPTPWYLWPLVLLVLPFLFVYHRLLEPMASWLDDPQHQEGCVWVIVALLIGTYHGSGPGTDDHGPYF
jgi:hypothetical protein